MAMKKATVEIDGIEVSPSNITTDDWEITEALADSIDPDATDAQKVQASVKFLRVMFGEDFPRIKRELREKNGGKLTNEAMNTFSQHVMEALAKN